MTPLEPTVDYPQPDRRPRVVRWIWRHVGPDTVAGIAECGELDGKAVQVFGTFGAATVTLRGGLVRDELTLLHTGSVWLEFTEPGLGEVPDVVFAQPTLTEASEETDVTVVLTGRRP